MLFTFLNSFSQEILEFNQGVLLYAILITSLIMTFAMIKARGKKIKDVLVTDLNINFLEDDAEQQMEEEIQDYHEAELANSELVEENEIIPKEGINDDSHEDIISKMEEE